MTFMNAKVRAALMTAFSKPLEIVEFPVPELESGSLIARIESAGICGSDLHIWHGRDPRIKCPVVIGHEGLGRIEAIGGEKKDLFGQPLKPGDRIIWERGLFCGKCYYCVMEKEPSLCVERRTYGMNAPTTHTSLVGNYAEAIYLFPQTNVIKLRESDKPEVYVSTSCSGATTAHSFELARPRVGDTVVVQGAGPIGLYAIAFAREAGAGTVVAVDMVEDRLRLAREFGADHLIDRKTTSIEEMVRTVKELTAGLGADFAVECSGAPESMEEGLKMIRRNGTYLVPGYASITRPINIDGLNDITNKQILIRGSWVSDTSHLFKAIQIVRKNKYPFDKMITHKFPLDDVNKALQALDRREAIKAALTP